MHTPSRGVRQKVVAEQSLDMFHPCHENILCFNPVLSTVLHEDMIPHFELALCLRYAASVSTSSTKTKDKTVTVSRLHDVGQRAMQN